MELKLLSVVFCFVKLYFILKSIFYSFIYTYVCYAQSIIYTNLVLYSSKKLNLLCTFKLNTKNPPLRRYLSIFQSLLQLL